MKRMYLSALAIFFALCFASQSFAHFGMLIPDKDEVEQKDKVLHYVLSFSHPFEGLGMDLRRPEKLTMYFEDKKINLLSTLSETQVMGHQAWKGEYKIKRPGMYILVMEPTAYPEPAEDNYIIHYTKTVVDAFGAGEEWNVPVGLKTEIVPLTRPFGNYAGNVFQGTVLLDGKPAPYTRVEVEYYNADGKKTAPNDRMVTQEVLADARGVFTFTCPWKGWWGFAALSDADYKIKGKDVELGAVLWIKMH